MVSGRTVDGAGEAAGDSAGEAAGDSAGDGRVHVVDSVLGPTVLLERPHRRNALTRELWQDVAEVVQGLGTAGVPDDPLYLMGSGGYFCSGADLGALAHARTGPEQAQEFVHDVVRALLTLHAVDREVVAVVEGGAAGGGVEIMVACDRRVAVGSPSFVFPFGQHGMQLDGLTRWRLPQLVGAEEAERLVDGRHVVDTTEALRLGLVDEHHPTLAAFVQAETARAQAAAGRAHRPGSGERYLSGLEEVGDAIPRAAAPMLLAF